MTKKGSDRVQLMIIISPYLSWISMRNITTIDTTREIVTPSDIWRYLPIMMFFRSFMMIRNSLKALSSFFLDTKDTLHNHTKIKFQQSSFPKQSVTPSFYEFKIIFFTLRGISHKDKFRETIKIVSTRTPNQTSS